jgi:hypothetical protein
MKVRPSHFESIDKEELRDLCDRLLTDDAAGLKCCEAECNPVGARNSVRAFPLQRQLAD